VYESSGKIKKRIMNNVPQVFMTIINKSVFLKGLERFGSAGEDM